MAGILVVGAIANAVHTACLENIIQRVGRSLRRKLFENIMKQDLAFFYENTSGELASRLGQDVHEVADHLVENVAAFLKAVIEAIFASIMMLRQSVALSLYTFSVVPGLLAVSLIYSRLIKRLGRRLLDVLAAATQHATQSITMIRTVRSFAAEDREVKRYQSIVDKSYTVAKSASILEGAFAAASQLVGSGVQLGVLLYGGRMVMDGKLTVGALTSFWLYAGSLREFLVEITEAAGGFLKAQGAGARLFGLLERTPSPTSALHATCSSSAETAVVPAQIPASDMSAALPAVILDRKTAEEVGARCECRCVAALGSPSLAWLRVAPCVHFDHVSFGYCASVAVIDDVSLHVAPGERIVFTGRSGSGKSTLMLLLQRLFSPSKGSVKINGMDLAGFGSSASGARPGIADWRRTVGVVEQEPCLFAMTIGENIAYGLPDASQVQIEHAAQQAQIHDFIMSLPRGYRSMVGERGVSLSGGQKQRLAIARALLHDPSVLVFDEAASALDALTANAVRATILGLAGSQTGLNARPRTVFVVSHHPAELAAADRVVVMDRGRVVQMGPFAELSKQEGLLKSLIESSYC